MARKDVIKGPAQELEAMQQEHPEFLDMAREVLNEWKGEYLVCVVARGLMQAHALGQKGRKPKRRSTEDDPTFEEEVAQANKPKAPPRVSRSRVTPAAPVSTMRVRRSRS